jgi:hypothetical protein
MVHSVGQIKDVIKHSNANTQMIVMMMMMMIMVVVVVVVVVETMTTTATTLYTWTNSVGIAFSLRAGHLRNQADGCDLHMLPTYRSSR